MENNSDSRFFCTPVLTFDTVAEQLADVDLTLPDYCPDIEKILKCSLVPKIHTKSLSGGQLQVDGCCVVSVLYVESENKTIRCCEQSVDFSQSFNVKDSQDCVVLAKTKPEYINCRVLSPRRLVIHGAFSLCVKALGSKKTELFTPGDEELETLVRTIGCADLTALCQEQFNVSEDISVADKAKIESVLNSNVTACVTDLKAVEGKLLINGELSVRIFYLSDIESGSTAKLDYILPFSRVIDCDGVSEETKNIVGVEVMSCDIRLKTDMLSDNPAVALDAKLCITAEGYDIGTREVITDAYSLSSESCAQMIDLDSIAEVESVSESFTEKLSASVDDGKISKILDIYADSVTLDVKSDGESLKASGKINLCVLALDGSEYPIFMERSCEYTHSLESARGCNGMFFPSARITGISYRLSDDSTAEIRCELKISGGAVKNESTRAVGGVEIFEDKPINSGDAPLTLYFAQEGENLWQIAKSHNTKLGLLVQENSLEELKLDSDRMLLIPKA